MTKVLKLTLTTEQFVNDKGEKIPYLSYKIEVNGKTFSLYPKADDKKLLNYLLLENNVKSDVPDDNEV